MPLLEVGDQIEGYVVEEKIGHGTFGCAYRARSPADQVVAIKEIFDTADDDAIDEARRLNQVTWHPNLGRVLPVTDERFLVMEFVKGPTLARTLQQHGPFTPEGWWYHFRCLLDGVSHLHSFGLVHRDIKPDNIIVSRNGCVLVDFGAARQAGHETAAIGTPGYAPPHAWDWPVGMPEPSWDVYSLAVVSHEMLTGRLTDPDKMAQKLGGFEVDYVRAIADGLRRVPTNRPSSIVDWVCRMVNPTASVIDTAVSSVSADLESSWPMPTSSEPDGSDELVNAPSTDGGDSSELWDPQTLAELRDQVVANFKLPKRSIAFLAKDDSQFAFHATVGRLCSDWTGRSQRDKPRDRPPKNRFWTKTVHRLRRKVENVYGLPWGSVTVLKPDGSRYYGHTKVSTVDRDHSD